MLQVWSPRREISTPGEELALNAGYDAKSPIWWKGYLDDLSRDGEIGRLRLPGVPESGEGSAYMIPSSICPTRTWLRDNSCARVKLGQAGFCNGFNRTRVKEQE